MSDIIDRFMAVYPEHHKFNYERLRAENEKLRAALKPFADLSSHWEGDKMPLEPKTITIDPLPVLYAVKEMRND